MLRIAVVDDEVDCIEEIVYIVSNFLSKKKISFQFFKYQSGEEFLSGPIYMDLVFLDIQMDGIDGINVAHILRSKNKHVALIYVTSFSSEMKRSFSVHPFAFLEKPINQDELIRNLEDFLNYSISTVVKNNIALKSNKGEIIICVQDILYFEYIGNRKLSLIKQNESLIVQGSVNEILQLLSPYHFISPHKSFIINTEQIERVQIPNIIMKNKDIIPISQKKQSFIIKEISFYLHHQMKGEQ